MKNLPFKLKDQDSNIYIFVDKFIDIIVSDFFVGMQIENINIVRDDKNKPKGFAFVEFKYQKEF